jgi:hypothetical protein
VCSSDLLRFRNGMRGAKRKRKKKGNPRRKSVADAISEAARRMRLSIQGFMVILLPD